MQPNSVVHKVLKVLSCSGYQNIGFDKRKNCKSIRFNSFNQGLLMFELQSLYSVLFNKVVYNIFPICHFQQRPVPQQISRKQQVCNTCAQGRYTSG